MFLYTLINGIDMNQKEVPVDIIQHVSTMCVKMVFTFYQTVACISDSQNNI